MSNQEMINFMLGTINRNNKKEVFQSILEHYSSLTDEERKEIDVSALHERLLDDIANFDGDLEILYGFGYYDAEFKAEAEERVKQCRQTTLICQYLDFNEVEREEFVILGLRAIASVMTDREEEVSALYRLREKAKEDGSYDDLINGIKTRGDVETVVCAALCFEPQLIDEVFGGKAQMYMYLSAGEFTDGECLELYRERLLTMDSCQLQNDMETNVRSLDEKIFNKKI